MTIAKEFAGLGPAKGTWQLVAWRRIAADGTISDPLKAARQLIYTPDGMMAVQMTAAGQPADANADANAYSTCIAYFGTYEVKGEQVMHQPDSGLFRTGAARSRPAPSALRAMSW
jgi:hypothetical protein